MPSTSGPGQEPRSRCAALLRRLDLPADAGLDELVAAIAAARGRKLLLCHMHAELPPERHGAWIATDVCDRVVVPAGASIDVIVHDLAHALCDHAPDVTGPAELVYTRAQEDEADHMARLIASAFPRLADSLRTCE
ncbi:MAG: hypothetical protein ACRDXX_01025 [Stackebrandtia sp.]